MSWNLNRRLVLGVLIWLFGMGVTAGQEGKGPEQGEGVAGGAGVGVSVPAVRGGGAGTGAPRVERGEPFLSWMARASGPIGLVILGMSFYLVVLVVWMFRVFRREVALPEGLVRELTELLGARRYATAYERVKGDGSFLGRVLSAGVGKLSVGLSQAQRAMELANERVTMEMEHRTTYLATVGTLGPMIGLVGTVYGMIMSFRVIATEGASPQASDLAAGISTSLFATLEGIALSVPAIAFYAYFRNRIARLALDVAITAEGLLEGFAGGLRNPHPLAAGAGAGGVAGRPALPGGEGRGGGGGGGSLGGGGQE